MTNRELNLKMAKVCGMAVIPRGEEPLPRYPQVLIGVERFMLLTHTDQTVDQTGDWNPVHNWNQVFEYVLPALRRIGYCWQLLTDSADKPEVHLWEDVVKGESAFRSCDTNDALCRCVCEAAWKAWQQLEKSYV